MYRDNESSVRRRPGVPDSGEWRSPGNTVGSRRDHIEVRKGKTDNRRRTIVNVCRVDGNWGPQCRVREDR